MPTKETIQKIIDLLEKAPRMGTDKDEPEGTRYIQISDTLAKEIVAQLKEESSAY